MNPRSKVWSLKSNAVAEACVGAPALDIWSAATCRRFIRLAGLSARQRRVERRAETSEATDHLTRTPKPDSAWPWVARATSPCRAATSRAERKGGLENSWPSIFIVAALPFRRASGPAARAGCPCHPSLLRSSGLRIVCLTTLDGDKSPAESGENSPHSKGFAASQVAHLFEHAPRLQTLGFRLQTQDYFFA